MRETYPDLIWLVLTDGTETGIGSLNVREVGRRLVFVVLGDVIEDALRKGRSGQGRLGGIYRVRW